MAVATTTTPTTARPDRALSAGNDVPRRDAGGRRTLGWASASRSMLAAVRAHRSRGGSGCSSRSWRSRSAVRGVRLGYGATRLAAGQVRIEPLGLGRCQRCVEPLGRAGPGAVMWRRPGIGPSPDVAKPPESVPRAHRVSCDGVAGDASAARSDASACRRLSRARVRSARAATWLTPRAAASSSPVRSCSSASRSAAR